MSKPYVQLVWHLSRCLTCLDANYDPGTAPLCPNGKRLMRECAIPEIPYPLPRDCAPMFASNAEVDFHQPVRGMLN